MEQRSNLQLRHFVAKSRSDFARAVEAILVYEPSLDTRLLDLQREFRAITDRLVGLLESIEARAEKIRRDHEKKLE